ncbi:hypothetical protein ABZ820_34695 [Streptomyces diacarni]|uniref:hypothetical protein n=1 Tax=Streptomyces diacarni TaxID=2800381 RepID=UPI0033E668A3
MPGRPVEDAERARVRELHARGLGRNAIAREIERGTRTVSLIAADLGLSFNRTATEEATRARSADLAELRTQLAHDLTLDALRLTQQMWEPAVVYNFGGKDNTYAERSVNEPPAGDKRALMAAAGAALDRSLRLVPPDPGDGAAEARSMLGQLAAGLQAAYDAATAEGSDDGGG